MSDDIVDRLTDEQVADAANGVNFALGWFARNLQVERTENARLRAEVERLKDYHDHRVSDLMDTLDRVVKAKRERDEAADEIAATCDRLIAEKNAVRALADQLAEALKFIQADIETDFGRTLTDDALAAYDKHKEARNG